MLAADTARLYRVLESIDDGFSGSVQQRAYEYKLTPPYLQAMLKELEKLGLIERQRQRNGGPGYPDLWTLTKKGERLHDGLTTLDGS